MKREDYIMASTITRVYENNLLSRADFQRLIETEDLESFKRALSEVGYSDAANHLNNREEFDNALDNTLFSIYRDYYKMDLDREVIDILTSRYDYHNLKVLVRSNISKKDLSHLLIDFSDYDFKRLEDVIKQTERINKDDKFEVLARKAMRDYEKNGDPQRVDMRVDKAFFENMLDEANKLDAPSITKYVKNAIDVQNINTILRAKSQKHNLNFLREFLIPGGNIDEKVFIENYNYEISDFINLLSGYDIFKNLDLANKRFGDDNEISHFEEEMSSFLADSALSGSKVTYGPEVLFNYLFRKEREIKIIRTIAIGKLNGLSSSDIKERIGELA